MIDRSTVLHLSVIKPRCTVLPCNLVGIVEY